MLYWISADNDIQKWKSFNPAEATPASLRETFSLRLFKNHTEATTAYHKSVKNEEIPGIHSIISVTIKDPKKGFIETSYDLSKEKKATVVNVQAWDIENPQSLADPLINNAIIKNALEQAQLNKVAFEKIQLINQYTTEKHLLNSQTAQLTEALNKAKDKMDQEIQNVKIQSKTDISKAIEQKEQEHAQKIIKLQEMMNTLSQQIKELDSQNNQLQQKFDEHTEIFTAEKKSILTEKHNELEQQKQTYEQVIKELVALNKKEQEQLQLQISDLKAALAQNKDLYDLEKKTIISQKDAELELKLSAQEKVLLEKLEILQKEKAALELQLKEVMEKTQQTIDTEVLRRTDEIHLQLIGNVNSTVNNVKAGIKPEPVPVKEEPIVNQQQINKQAEQAKNQQSMSAKLVKHGTQIGASLGVGAAVGYYLYNGVDALTDLLVPAASAAVTYLTIKTTEFGLNKLSNKAPAPKPQSQDLKQQKQQTQERPAQKLNNLLESSAQPTKSLAEIPTNVKNPLTPARQLQQQQRVQAANKLPSPTSETKEKPVTEKKKQIKA